MADKRSVVQGEVVRLDYTVLRDTIFRSCKLVFEGGRPPSMIGCDFVDCEFILEGAARNTQIFMTLLAKGGAGELVVHQMLGLSDWKGPK